MVYKRFTITLQVQGSHCWDFTFRI